MTGHVISIISESEAVSLFFTVTILLLSAVLCGKLVTLLKLPKVVGEILGGFLLGPALFGRFFPDLYGSIFFSFDGHGSALSVFYWLGLMFLMFASGCQSNFENIKDDKKIIGCLAAGATIPPLILGYLISDRFFADYYLGTADNRTVFNIIFALYMAVTSLPVISKIFMDLGLIRHRFARIILVTSTIQAFFLWPVLALSTSVITNQAFIFADFFLHTGFTLAMFAFAILITPRLKRFLPPNKLQIFTHDSLIFLICFCTVYFGGLFNVNIMYSAFVAGIIYKNVRSERAVASQAKLEDICLAFFTPLYFAIVGLRLYVGGDFSVGRFLAVLIIAHVVEMLSCFIAMKSIKLDWLSSLNLGVAMNARGGPGIVLASIAFDLDIINNEFFFVLVFVVLVTTATTGYWIDFINKKGKLFENVC